MRSIRVVKRGEREATNQRDAEVEKVVHRTTPEMVVKGWVTAARERRRADADLYRRNLGHLEENLSPVGS